MSERKSYPFLSIARWFAIDYGHVLSFADAYRAKNRRGTVTPLDGPWQIAAGKAISQHPRSRDILVEIKAAVEEHTP